MTGNVIVVIIGNARMIVNKIKGLIDSYCVQK